MHSSSSRTSWPRATASRPSVTSEVRAVRVTPIGTGQTGATYRLTVEYTVETGLPASFAVKLPSQDDTVRDRVAIGYRSEHAFYNDIADLLHVVGERDGAATWLVPWPNSLQRFLSGPLPGPGGIPLVRDGRLRYREDVVDGLEKLEAAHRRGGGGIARVAGNRGVQLGLPAVQPRPVAPSAQASASA